MNRADLLIPPPQFEARLAALPANQRELVAQGAARSIDEVPFLQTDAGRVTAWELAFSEHEGLRRRLAKQAAIDSAPQDAERFIRASVGGWSLLQRDLPPPVSIIGSGHLCAGDMASFVGEGGAGKSQALCQLAVARATAPEWLGFKISAGRTGLLMMELDEAEWQRRLRVIAGDLAGGALDAIRLVCRPHLRGVVSLNSDADMTALRRWIEHERIDLVGLDPWVRLHQLDENSAQDMGGLLNRLDALRMDTGCAIWINQHSRKSQGGRHDSSPRDAARGSGVFGDFPAFQALIEKRGAFRRIRFGKTSRAAEPADLWLAIDPNSGVLTVTESRSQKGEATRAKVLEALRTLGTNGVKVKAIALEVGASESTVKNHLAPLEHDGEARRTGQGKDTLWWPGPGPADRAEEVAP